MFQKIERECWKNFVPTLCILLCDYVAAVQQDIDPPKKSLKYSKQKMFMNKELGILKVKSIHRNEPKKTFIFHFTKSVTHSESNNNQQSVLKSVQSIQAIFS